MVAENRRVPTLSNLSPCSWYLTLFEDKQGSKSGGIDIWCFIHLVYMLFNWFSSLYRVFLVLFESLQVWSCIGWEMDQLEQKRQKTVQFGDFHAEQSWWLFWIAEQPEWLFRIAEQPEWLFRIAEQPECLFQRQKFLWKLQPISGFALISLFSIPAACGFDISSFSVSPD